MISCTIWEIYRLNLSKLGLHKQDLGQIYTDYFCELDLQRLVWIDLACDDLVYVDLTHLYLAYMDPGHINEGYIYTG